MPDRKSGVKSRVVLIAKVEDYLKELLAGALAEQVSKAFSKQAPARSGPSPFADMPGDYFDPPSNAFAELYGATRISSDPGFKGSDGANPISGDIYFEGTLPKSAKSVVVGKSILAVMSPICDLVDRGDKPPAAKSVLLLRGTLAHSLKGTSGPNPIAIGSRLYEIDWDLKFPQALKIEDLKQKVEGSDLKWVGRLRQEHFLSLQADYLASLGRIGVLKAPAHFEALAGRICIREGNVEAPIGDPFKAKQQFAFLSREHNKPVEKQSVFFTGEFVVWFLEQLNTIQNDTSRVAATKGKAKTLIEKLSPVVELQKNRTLAQHKFNDVLSVTLVAGTTAAAAKTQEIQILLWRV